jgi:glycosyltransferase involved in cell wall biosynthesis
MRGAVRITVIVCSYNRSALLMEALLVLLDQTYSRKWFEILVVDNASIDDTAAKVDQFIAAHSGYSIRYCYEPQQGLSRARNCGVANARGEWVAFIDDDALAGAKWLESLFDVIKNGQAEAIGGPIELEFRAPIPYWLTDRFHGWLGRYRTAQERAYRLDSPPWPGGGNMAFRRELLLEMGGFDPELGRRGEQLLAAEETVFFRQMGLEERKIWLQPAAVVRHIIGPDRLKMGYFIRLQQGLMRSRAIYYNQVKPLKRLVLVVRCLLELLGNGILLLLSLLVPRYLFLAYLFFYRSLLKLGLLLS